jgi:hypothetical protein
VLESDNPITRASRLVLGLITAVIVVFTALTAVFSFPAKGAANATAVAKSCEDYGPISRRGFGHQWVCEAVITDYKTGETWTDVVDMNILTDEDIGNEKAISWGYQRGRAVMSDKRVYSPADGYSEAVHSLVLFPSFIIGGVGAFAMVVIGILGAMTRQSRRALIEKSFGTREERTAKKQAEEAERQASKARLAELRRKAKEKRESGH